MVLRASETVLRRDEMAEQTGKKSSPILIAVAWLIVLVPATWGLTYTVKNAMKIFQPGAAPVVPGTAPAAAK
jgi:hypothetical protein